jgi:hypothetical protein
MSESQVEGTRGTGWRGQPPRDAARARAHRSRPLQLIHPLAPWWGHYDTELETVEAPRPRPGTIIEEQDIYFRASALLNREQNNLPLVSSEQAVA